MSFTSIPIGYIETPFETLEGMPIQPAGAAEVLGTLVIEKEFEEGLKDLEGFSHLILLYEFHKSAGFELLVKPFLDTQKRGLFATRAPRRPNPIGLSIVEFLGREGNRVMVRGIDVLSGTPLLDIKPYVPAFDAKPGALAGWLEKKQDKAGEMKSDSRFI